MSQYFSIGPPMEDMAPGAQPLTQLLMVVDLAVVDDLDAAVFVGHRLRSAPREVHQGEATVDQLTPAVCMAALPVRATVREQGIRPEPPIGIGRKRNWVEATGETAHGQPLT
jgi:hypothetical protein